MGWRINDVEPADGRRHPLEKIVEDKDQKQPEEEGWRGLTDGRDQAANVVDRAAWLKRRASAERYAEPERDQESEEGELDRGRQPMAEVVEHALAGGQRLAQIASGQPLDVKDELLGKGAIEAEVMTGRLNGVGCRGGAGEIGSGIPGEQARKDEGHDDDANHRRDGREQPRRDEPHRDQALPAVRRATTSNGRV